MKPEWKPDWATAGRSPAFVGDSGPPVVMFGGNKHLFGNVFAIDVLQLAKNEGDSYDKDIKLLFAGKSNIQLRPEIFLELLDHL
jgi:hypothetical protein